MKINRGFLQILILVLVSAAFVFALANGRRSTRAQQTPSPEEEYKEQMALVAALRRGGLREAAKLKGNYVETYDPYHDYNRFGAEKLAKGSAAIVVGVPTRNRCRLTPDGQLITTDYEVTVSEVIKGSDLDGVGSITVKLPGGKVMFPDQTTAEVVTPETSKMVHGRTYLMFLTTEPGEEGYRVVGGPSGLLELAPGGKVKSHGRAIDPVTDEVKNKSVKDFLKDIRRFAQRYPQPGRCCG
jgi:hypothetical protein